MDAAGLTFEVLPDARLLQAAADRIVSLLRAALAREGRVSLALSGGSTTVGLCDALAREDLDFARLDIFQVDERAVPPTHPDSNFRIIQEHLLGPLGDRAPRCVRMEGEAADLDAAARTYAEALPARMEVVVLGIGPDGHTASLFPGSPLLREAQARVAVVLDSPKPPPRRLTLTLPTLLGARHVVGIAAGASKRDVMAQLRGGADLPAARVRPATWLLDASADAGG